MTVEEAPSTKNSIGTESAEPMQSPSLSRTAERRTESPFEEPSWPVGTDSSMSTAVSVPRTLEPIRKSFQ